MRHTAFTFTLCPTAEQRVGLWRHAGAARFAYNRQLALVKQGLDARKRGDNVKIPWSGFDHINAFNKWKVSPAAGVDEGGAVGLPWRREVGQQVFEEAVVDLGRGLSHWQRGRKSRRKVGFPRFRKRGKDDAFRLRNKKNTVRVTENAVLLPHFGSLAVRESTRVVRRLLRPRADGSPSARILFATVAHRCSRWVLRLNVEAPAFHPAARGPKTVAQRVGVDMGLHAFAVAADASGNELWREHAPKPLGRNLKRLRRLSRRLSHKKKDSKRRQAAKKRLARLHQHIANIRRAHVHALTRHVAKTHSHVVLENLHIAGMMRNHSLARHIADSCWGQFARQLAYKGPWYGCRVSSVNRFAPTSKTCCRCDWVAPSMPLSVRTFVCAACGWTADRDTNAAANCARWGPEE